MILNQREYTAALEQRRRLERARADYLARPQADPRMHGHGDCFESCPAAFRGGRNWETGEMLLPDLPPVGEYNRELETFQDLRKKGD